MCYIIYINMFIELIELYNNVVVKIMYAKL